MDYGFFVEPGTDVSKLNNQVVHARITCIVANMMTIRLTHAHVRQTFGDVYTLRTRRDSSRKRTGGSGTSIDGLSFVSVMTFRRRVVQLFG